MPSRSAAAEPPLSKRWLCHRTPKSVQQYFRPLEIEPEAHFLQPRLRHGLAQALAVLGVKEQKAAAARPHQLSAHRAVVSPQLVPLVDLRIAHLLRAVLLV